jgi:HEAT repeat protein
VHASAAGLFVTVDGGALWQPLAGPAFPEARHALGMVLVPGQPLRAQAVTLRGLQVYAPDLMQILATLESDEPQGRAAAARQLGFARAPGTWEPLLVALDDPEPAVSWAAADALGQINDPAAVPALLVAIEHPSGQVRLGAARALGMMRVEAAVEPLRAMLLEGDGPEVSIAGEALGRIGGPSATGALLAALVSPEPVSSGNSAGTLPSAPRWHAAMAALEGMGEPAVAPLVAMLDSQDAHDRRTAAQLLGWIGSPLATEALADALKTDGDAAVRAQSAWALGEIGDPAARRILERAQLRDPAAEVQTLAGRALSRMPAQSEGALNWAAQMAPAFHRLQPVRWLVLALSLAAAAWLMGGTQFRITVPLRVRLRHR